MSRLQLEVCVSSGYLVRDYKDDLILWSLLGLSIYYCGISTINVSKCGGGAGVGGDGVVNY